MSPRAIRSTGRSPWKFLRVRGPQPGQHVVGAHDTGEPQRELGDRLDRRGVHLAAAGRGLAGGFGELDARSAGGGDRPAVRSGFGAQPSPGVDAEPVERGFDRYVRARAGPPRPGKRTRPPLNGRHVRSDRVRRSHRQRRSRDRPRRAPCRPRRARRAARPPRRADRAVRCRPGRCRSCGEQDDRAARSMRSRSSTRARFRVCVLHDELDTRGQDRSAAPHQARPCDGPAAVGKAPAGAHAGRSSATAGFGSETLDALERVARFSAPCQLAV